MHERHDAVISRNVRRDGGRLWRSGGQPADAVWRPRRLPPSGRLGMRGGRRRDRSRQRRDGRRAGPGGGLHGLRPVVPRVHHNQGGRGHCQQPDRLPRPGRVRQLGRRPLLRADGNGRPGARGEALIATRRQHRPGDRCRGGHRAHRSAVGCDERDACGWDVRRRSESGDAARAWLRRRRQLQVAPCCRIASQSLSLPTQRSNKTPHRRIHSCR